MPQRGGGDEAGQGGNSQLAKLPQGTLLSILLHLPWRNELSVRRVCKQFNHCVGTVVAMEHCKSFLTPASWTMVHERGQPRQVAHLAAADRTAWFQSQAELHWFLRCASAVAAPQRILSLRAQECGSFACFVLWRKSHWMWTEQLPTWMIPIDHVSNLFVTGDEWQRDALQGLVATHWMIARNAPESIVGPVLQSTAFKLYENRETIVVRHVICNNVSNPEEELKLIRQFAGVSFSQIPSIIPQNSLASNTLLSVVQLIGVVHVTHIGENCLSSCPNLRRVEVAALTSLKEIGSGFLANCDRLQHVQFTDLPALMSLGDKCLSCCRCLRSLDICALPALNKIGAELVASCSSIRIVTLSVLPVLASIGAGCAAGCRSLNGVILLGMPMLATIGEGFFDGCPLRYIEYASVGVVDSARQMFESLEGRSKSITVVRWKS